jgi:hypothetical protein
MNNEKKSHHFSKSYSHGLTLSLVNGCRMAHAFIYLHDWKSKFLVHAGIKLKAVSGFSHSRPPTGKTK